MAACGAVVRGDIVFDGEDIAVFSSEHGVYGKLHPAIDHANLELPGEDQHERFPWPQRHVSSQSLTPFFGRDGQLYTVGFQEKLVITRALDTDCSLAGIGAWRLGTGRLTGNHDPGPAQRGQGNEAACWNQSDSRK